MVNANVAVSVWPVARHRNKEAALRSKASIVVVYEPGDENRPLISERQILELAQAKLPLLRSENIQVLLIPDSGRRVAVDRPAVGRRRMVGCAEIKAILGIDVCRVSLTPVVSVVVVSFATAGVLVGLWIVSILRSRRYRSDLTRVTEDFEKMAER